MTQDLIGTPFKENGTTPDGMDCMGLLLEMYRRQGVELAPYAGDYQVGTEESRALLAESMEALFVVADRPYQPLDVALCDRPGTDGAHVALHVSGDRWIHSDRNVGVVIIRWERTQSYVVEVYRYAEC